MSNRSFLVLFLAGVFFNAATGLVFALGVYFNTYFWRLNSFQIFLLAIGTLFAAGLAFAVALPLSKRFGKKDAAMVLFGSSLAIGVIPLSLRMMNAFVPNGSHWLVPLLAAFNVVSATMAIASAILLGSMLADVVEDSERMTGRRSEGLFFAASSFNQKAASGLGLLFSGLILSVIHFPSNALPGHVNPDIVRNLALAYVPSIVVLYGLAIVIVGFYRITREDHEENLRRLAEEALLSASTIGTEAALIDARLPRQDSGRPDMDAEQPVSTDRYTKKKDAIVAAAAGILNRRGVKGMTLADVAASVDLITTSVTYYFKKKEDLAVACFLQSLERYDVLITRSLGAADPHDRFLAFLTNFLELNRRIREGEEAPLAVFNDVRSLRDPHFTIVMTRYRDVFRKIRSIFAGPGYEWMTLKKATARSHMLLEQLFWSVTWLPRYDTEDYPRIRDRMFDIFAHGVARDGAQWQPVPLAALYRDLGDSHETSRETFLRAATKLINFRGYRGASVEKISAQLNVTKGSFYHHNEAKDDLVVACFERSFGIMRRAQSFAMRGDGDLWCKLSSAAAALVEYQLSDAGPLLRSSALSALPEPIRQNMVDQFSRASDRFAAMISDGIAEGSLRAVDPSIAAQMLNATLNGSADLPFVIPGLQGAEMGKLYAKPMLMGIFER